MELQSPTIEPAAPEAFGPLQEGFRQQLWPPCRRTQNIIRTVPPSTYPKRNDPAMPRHKAAAGGHYPRKSWMTTEPIKASMDTEAMSIEPAAIAETQQRPTNPHAPNAGTRKGNTHPVNHDIPKSLNHDIPKSLKDRIMREEALCSSLRAN
eukprot:CAMPEP_0170181008 /NCGR_PEP_ID=MMETSP0040_2-20121228/23681_1 /TAXON_ID=641309 /ORGANISM="Lotharella oceanica, Strain CCMP622" /LENGTH=150 /DNA_ID=CAMNT_0010425861 /DNA_START=711 /DNA_END=1163 /DNA_ORIENTATION=+